MISRRTCSSLGLSMLRVMVVVWCSRKPFLSFPKNDEGQFARGIPKHVFNDVPSWANAHSSTMTVS